MNNKDYYKILGITKSATHDEVKKAFRKLAHEHHPDKKGGDDAKFKEASEAYNVLGDEKKRAQYDQFGSGFSGAGGGQGGFNQGQGFGGFDFSGFQGGGFNGQDVEFDLGDIFNQFFGGGRARKGKNVRVDVDISFKESIFGTEKEVRSPDGKLTISIPTGVENRTTLRVPGRGEKIEGGQQGDLLVHIYVHPDPRFKKQGMNIITDAKIPLSLSLLGGEHVIPSLDNDLTLKVPERVSNGEILRVKSKGVPDERGHRGDLYVRITVDVSKKLSKNARRLVEELKNEGM